MSNITKIDNGFILNDNTYNFEEFDLEGILVKYQLLSDNQLHIGTSNGVILLDLTCSIDGAHYKDINEFIKSIF